MRCATMILICAFGCCLSVGMECRHRRNITNKILVEIRRKERPLQEERRIFSKIRVDDTPRESGASPTPCMAGQMQAAAIGEDNQGGLALWVQSLTGVSPRKGFVIPGINWDKRSCRSFPIDVFAACECGLRHCEASFSMW